jgi:hypothetical protein
VNALRLLVATLGLSLGTVPPLASAAEPGYDIWFAGHIISVDSRHGTLTIARGPTQTSGPAVELCTLNREPLQRVRVGMEIEAQADTHRRPWRILHWRIFQMRTLRKNTAVVALTR